MKFKTFCTLFELQKIKNHYKHCITNVYSDLFYALGGQYRLFLNQFKSNEKIFK
ncbi:hypothetical protein [Listeria phage vB_Lmo_C2]